MPRIHIPAILGMDRARPYGSSVGQEGAYPRLLHNLRPDHGEISRRPGTAAISSPPTLDTVIGATKTEFDVLHIQEVNVLPATSPPRHIIFTEREGWLGRPGSWTKINPVHDTGTIDVTNGSAIVTGNGTSWLTRGIKSRDYLIAPDGNLYEIASVDNDTQITLQATYQGSTLSTQSYEIERTFTFSYGDRHDAIGEPGAAIYPFVVSLQQHLYVAGHVAGGTFSSSNIADAGVFKIANGANGTVLSWTPSSDITYLLSGNSVVESGVDSLGYNFEIYGMGKIADGRLVLAVRFFDLASSLSGNRRVVYSSHLSLAAWTSSPGGATDVEDIEGAVTATVFYSNSVSFHFTDGIGIGELTGQDDPPLRFRPSKSSVGAMGPRLVTRFVGGSILQGREAFLGTDGKPYLFNGLNSTPISKGGIELEFQQDGGGSSYGPQSKESLVPGIVYEDSSRSELAFAFFDGTNTKEIRISYETGDFWRSQYSGFVGAFLVPSIYDALSISSPFDVNVSDDYLILGTRTDSSWWWRASEKTATDALSQTRGSQGGVLLFIDGIDGGKPETNKVIQEILLFFREPRQLDGGAFSPTVTWHGETHTNQTTTLRESVNPSVVSKTSYRHRTEAMALYVTTKKNWRSLGLEISSPDDDSWTKNLTRIVINYEETGNEIAE